MTSLMDVLGTDIGTINSYIIDGWLRQGRHNTEPLAILNYTDKTTYMKKWDQVTLNCRGLIYNTDTLEVVARPFKKFFNYSEGSAPYIAPSERVLVTSKVDGSLGVLYREPSTGCAAIATRGSFHSVQAEHANKVLKERHATWVNTYESVSQNDIPVTLVFEIIFPEDRKVVDYGDVDDLILLGGVAIPDGEVLNTTVASAIYSWGGHKAEILGYMSFAEALNLPDRKNKEGIVMRVVEDDRMIKIKQDDYVRMHRIVSGLNARSVWAELMDHDDTSALKEALPEEFWEWIDSVEAGLRANRLELEIEIMEDYYHYAIVNGDRGENARSFANARHPWAMFAKMDGNFILLNHKLWQMVKPPADWVPPAKVSDDITEA